MKVYLDLLILDNFCADAALLYCAVRTVKGEAKLWRIALSALLGTALGVGYTILTLYYTLPVPVDYLIKYGVAVVLPWTAMRARRRRTYAFCSLAFVMYMFAFAGLLTALFSDAELAGGEGSTLVYTVAGLPSGVLVLAAVMLGFLAARCGRALARRAKAAAQLCTCKLVLGGQQVTVRALVDTGNKLCDRRGRGVPVADPAAVFALLGGSLHARTPCEELAVTTVNGSSKLKTFRVDKLEIYCADKAHILKDVTVALGARPLAGEYGLILPSSLTEEEDFARGGKAG